MQGLNLFAQQANGQVFEVINDKEIPLIGATIVQLNTQNGVITDANGFFQIDLESAFPKVLVVSFVSYQNDTIFLERVGFDNIHVVLNETKDLNEIEIKARQKGSFLERNQVMAIVNLNEIGRASCRERV